MLDAPNYSRFDRTPSQRNNASAHGGASVAKAAPPKLNLMLPLPKNQRWPEQLTQAGWHVPRPSAPPPPSPPRAASPVARSLTPRGSEAGEDRHEVATLLDQAFDVRARGELLLKRAQVLAELENTAGKRGPATAALQELQRILRVETQA